VNNSSSNFHTLTASSNKDHAQQSHYYCLFAPHIYGCCSSCISRSWWIAHLTQRNWRGCNNILSFLQWTALIACSFHEVWIWPDLQILPTAPLSCDRKARAASAQSFTLWQQAAIDIMRRNHSIIACLHHIYMRIVLRAYPVVVKRTFNATRTERLQQYLDEV